MGGALAVEIGIYLLILLFSARCIFIFIWSIVQSWSSLLNWEQMDIFVMRLLWCYRLYEIHPPTQGSTQYYWAGWWELLERCRCDAFCKAMLTWIVIRMFYSSVKWWYNYSYSHLRKLYKLHSLISGSGQHSDDEPDHYHNKNLTTP